MPEIGIIPIKASDAIHTYTFKSWDRPFEPVLGIATYQAVYDVDYQPDYYSEGLGFLHNPDSESFSVYEYVGTDPEVVIPDTFLGKPVTRIRKSAFRGNDKIESLHLGANVNEVDQYALTRMGGLKAISVAKGNQTLFTGTKAELFKKAESEYEVDELIAVPAQAHGLYTVADKVEIRVGAFSESNLSMIKLSADHLMFDMDNRYFRLFDATYGKSSPNVHHIIIDGGNIPEACFANEQYVSSITILENETNPTETIGEYAFYNVQKLESLVLPNSVETIYEYAIAYDNALNELIIGSQNNSKLTTVKPKALLGTRNIKAETIVDNYSSYYITYLGNTYHKSSEFYVFTGVQRLIAYDVVSTTSYYKIDDECVYIADSAFEGKTISGLTWGSSSESKLRSIGARAFYNAGTGSSFRFPSYVSYFGDEMVSPTQECVFTYSASSYGGAKDTANNYCFISHWGAEIGTATSITIPASVKGHTEGIFGKNLAAIKTINVASGNPRYEVVNESFLFMDHTKLVYAGTNVNSFLSADINWKGPSHIEAYALARTKITKLYLQSTTKYIGENAFPMADYEFVNWVFPEAVLELGNCFTSGHMTDYGMSDTIHLPACAIKVGSYLFGTAEAAPRPYSIVLDAEPHAGWDSLAFNLNSADDTIKMTVKKMID